MFRGDRFGGGGGSSFGTSFGSSFGHSGFGHSSPPAKRVEPFPPPACDECGEAQAQWNCKDGCAQLLCNDCDKFIHADGALRLHSRILLRVLCFHCARAAEVTCSACELVFCTKCSTKMHAKGLRAQHAWELMTNTEKIPTQVQAEAGATVERMETAKEADPQKPSPSAEQPAVAAVVPPASIPAAAATPSSVAPSAVASPASPAAASVAVVPVSTAHARFLAAKEKAAEARLAAASKPKPCSFVVTGKKFAPQIYYPCMTCDPKGGYGICVACHKNGCHDGHTLGAAKRGSFYCDCGAAGPPLILPCKSMPSSEVMAVEALSAGGGLPPFLTASYASHHPHAGATHRTARCDGCRSTIVGMRYQCLCCPDYDLCGQCYDIRLLKHGGPPMGAHVYALLPRVVASQNSARFNYHAMLALADQASCAHLLESSKVDAGCREESSVHEGVSCRMCSVPSIKGARYTCLGCSIPDAKDSKLTHSFDLCQPCYTRWTQAVLAKCPLPALPAGPAEQHLSSHVFAHISFPLSNAGSLKKWGSLATSEWWPLLPVEKQVVMARRMQRDPLWREIQRLPPAPTVHKEEPLVPAVAAASPANHGPPVASAPASAPASAAAAAVPSTEGQPSSSASVSSDYDQSLSGSIEGGASSSDSDRLPYSSPSLASPDSSGYTTPGAAGLSSQHSCYSTSHSSSPSEGASSYTSSYSMYSQQEIAALPVEGAQAPREQGEQYGQYGMYVDVGVEGGAAGSDAGSSSVASLSSPASPSSSSSSSSAASTPQLQQAPAGGPAFTGYNSYATYDDQADAYSNNHLYDDAAAAAALIDLMPPTAGAGGAADAPTPTPVEAVPARPAADPVASRDWNAEYQQLTEEHQSLEAQIRAFSERGAALTSQDQQALSDLRSRKFGLEIAQSEIQSSFATHASRIAQTIILELGLPAALRSIHPASDVGGIAGGEKYVVGRMFFKFALDLKNLYGSDEHAMKSASCELKGIMAYRRLGLPKLCTPLVQLVDFMGYRLIVSSLLPLPTKASGIPSLVYGSDNQCTTVHASDARCNSLMSEAAYRLNLKPHVVGSGEQAKELAAPGDIEVHRGTDQRYYVIDAARVSPPEAPRALIPCILLQAGSNPAVNLNSSEQSLSTATFNEPAITIVDLNRATVLAESQAIILQALRDQVRQHQEAAARGAALDNGDGQEGEAALPLNAEQQGLLSNVRCAAMQIAGVLMVYEDLTRAQQAHPCIAINRRASLLTGRRIYGDCIAIPGFLGTHLYHLMRMEFVETYSGPLGSMSTRIPLSSDGYTFFGRHDAAKHNAEIKIATNVLVQQRIKLLADKLLGLDPATSDKSVQDGALNTALAFTSSPHLIAQLHSHGLNCRFLGKLRSQVWNDSAANVSGNQSRGRTGLEGVRGAMAEQARERVSMMLLTEMIARVFKTSIRAKLRGMERPPLPAPAAGEVLDAATLQAMRLSHKDDLIHRMKILIIRELNWILGPHRMPAHLERWKNSRTEAEQEAALAFLNEQPDGALWNDTLKTRIQMKFGLWSPALSPEELASDHDLGQSMLRFQLLHSLSESLGLVFDPAVLRTLQRGDAAFLATLEPLHVKDLLAIQVQVNGDEVEQRRKRGVILQELKRSIGEEEAMATCVVEPAAAPQGSFAKALHTILGFFTIPALVAPAPSHPLLATAMGPVLHLQLRTEAIFLDRLVALFQLDRPRAASEQSSIHGEFRASLVHLARLVTQLSDREQRKFLQVFLREGVKEDQVAEACRGFAVQLIQQALTPVLRASAPDVVLGGPPAASSPLSFQSGLMPLEVVLKGYALLALVAEQRGHLLTAIELLRETLQSARLTFGGFKQKNKTQQTGVHPFMLSLLHQLVSVMRRANLHEFASSYVSDWLDVYRHFGIIPFVTATARIAERGRASVVHFRPHHLQANQTLFRNLMRMAFGVDVPVIYFSAMELRKADSNKELLKSCTPYAWLNHAGNSARPNEQSTPTEPEAEALMAWANAMHFSNSITVRIESADAAPNPSSADQHAAAAKLVADSMVPSHAHPLLLYSHKHGVGSSFSCALCASPGRGASFSCAEEKCSYDTHPSCFAKARKKPACLGAGVGAIHEHALEHQLKNSYTCAVCGERGEGVTWSCGNRGCSSFDSHETCALQNIRAGVTVGRMQASESGACVTFALPQLGGLMMSVDDAWANRVPARAPRLDIAESQRQAFANPLVPAENCQQRLYAWGNNSARVQEGTVLFNVENGAGGPAPPSAPGGDPHALVAVAHQPRGSSLVAATRNGAVYAAGAVAGLLGIVKKFSQHRNLNEAMPPLMYCRSLTGKKVVSVAVGYAHLLLVTDNGLAFSAGEGKSGVLGHSDEQDRPTPRLLESLQSADVKVVLAKARNNSSMLLASTGILYGFGDNANNLLGVGVPKGMENGGGTATVGGEAAASPVQSVASSKLVAAKYLLAPTVIPIPLPVAAFAMSDRSSMFVTHGSGLLYRAGDSHWISGEGGMNTSSFLPVLVTATAPPVLDPRQPPVPVRPSSVAALSTPTILRFKDVSVANYHVVLLGEDERVYTMGRGHNGGHTPFALGTGTPDNIETPMLVDTLADVRVTAICAGDDNSWAVSHEGRLWVWGAAIHGPGSAPPASLGSSRDLQSLLDTNQPVSSEFINRIVPAEFKVMASPVQPKTDAERGEMERAGIAPGVACTPVRWVSVMGREAFALAGAPAKFPAAQSPLVAAPSAAASAAASSSSSSASSSVSRSLFVGSSLAIARGFTPTYSSHPFSKLLNVSLSAKVYHWSALRSNPDNVAVSSSSLTPIKLLWSLPYIPVHDVFNIYVRKPGGGPVREVVKDPSYNRQEKIGEGRDTDGSGGETKQYERDARAGSLSTQGERNCADLPVGNYVGLWKLGGQSRTMFAQPWIAFEFSVVP